MTPTSGARSLAAGRLRRWTFAVCAVWMVLALCSYLPPLAPHRWPNPWRLMVIAGVALAQAGLLLAAARRTALGRRLQQALGMLAAAMLLVSISDTLVILMRLPTTGPALSRVNDILETIYTSLGLLALFWMPLAPLGRRGHWLVAVDIAVAVGGMVLVLLVTTTFVDLSAARPSEHSRIIQYGLFTAGNLVAINIILVRGLARPIPSAIWFLATTAVLEIGYWVIVQLNLGGLHPDMRLLDVVFAADQVCYALAALAFLTAPVGRQRDPLTPDWLRDMNPLPAVAVAAVGGLLVERALAGSSASMVPLSAGMVALSMLLVARVLLAAHDRAQLIRVEAETEQRLLADRVNAVRRLAGGIAHEFNNLMTVVLGNAELGLADAGPDSPLAASFEEIQRAGRRAADLTAHLLTYAGGAPIAPLRVDLAAVLLGARARVQEIVGPGVNVAYDVALGGLEAEADHVLIEQAVMHLASNASAAMPAGGQLHIMLREERVAGEELAGAILQPAPGRYEVIEVSDTGTGIDQKDLQRVFDPFYSSRSLAVSSGLGLAVVHGTMASHGGGLTVSTALGVGTTIRLYVPVVSSREGDRAA